LFAVVDRHVVTLFPWQIYIALIFIIIIIIIVCLAIFAWQTEGKFCRKNSQILIELGMEIGLILFEILALCGCLLTLAAD